MVKICEPRFGIGAFVWFVIGKFEVPYFRKIHYPEMVKFRYHSGVDSVKRAIFVAVGSTGSEPYAKSGQIYDLEQS